MTGLSSYKFPKYNSIPQEQAFHTQLDAVSFAKCTLSNVRHYAHKS